jgi:hypothetical protein
MVMLLAQFKPWPGYWWIVLSEEVLNKKLVLKELCYVMLHTQLYAVSQV